jgi:sulfur carrier protein
VKITINGQPRELGDGTTIGTLIAQLGGSSRGRAAVVDGEVVPRSAWPAAVLREGQSVELIAAVPGG